MSKASLAEIMGKKAKDAKGKGLSLADLPELLGDGMPEMGFHPLGRLRLIRALQQRFGDGFRSVPGVRNIISEFDQSASFESKLGEFKKNQQALGKKKGS